MPQHSRIRVAVVGAGMIGRRHIEFLQRDARFEAVGTADPSPYAAEFSRRLGVPWFADYITLLDRVRPRGVIVATPNQLHEEVAFACLERGIPALIEKPIAHTLESALRIGEAAKRSGVAVLVGHHRRHNPMLRTAVSFVEQGGIGRLVAVAAMDLRRKPADYFEAKWRREPGGGPLLINGIHDIDCLRALCGDIESVLAVTANGARGFAVEDTAAITFAFRSGAVGNLTISDAVQAPWAWEITSGEEPGYPHEHQDTYLLCGTDGSLAVPTLTHWRNERGGGRGDPFLRRQLYYTPADPWIEELKHFADVIEQGRAPLVTVEDGTRTLATTLAIARSAQLRRPVTVDEMYSG